jgi:hypothetical protein
LYISSLNPRGGADQGAGRAGQGIATRRRGEGQGGAGGAGEGALVGGGRGCARGAAELPNFAVALDALRVDVLRRIAKALKPPRWCLVDCRDTSRLVKFSAASVSLFFSVLITESG